MKNKKGRLAEQGLGDAIAKARLAISAGDTSGVSAALQTLADGLHQIREPSMAGSIGKAGPLDYSMPGKRKYHKIAKAAYLEAGKPEPGALITAIYQSRQREDAQLQLTGKATLEAMGLRYEEDLPSRSVGLIPGIAKATLGTTGATGGYVLPNNLVDQVVKPPVMEFTVSDLCTVRGGIMVRGVDQPYRTGAPSRAQMSNWGTQKENRNEEYGSYTATLGTMALIYDVGKQYLRFSAGAAEQDVFDELAKAHRLGEVYEVLAGPGTGALTPGVNDPCEGIVPAINAAAPTYTTTFAGASASTIAGNAATGIAKAIKALTSRAVIPNAILMDTQSYWDIAVEGNDTAGFFTQGSQVLGATANGVRWLNNGQLSMWGVPIFVHNQFDTYTGTTKAAIVGDFKALRIYRGTEFRIDSSDQAGTRWDLNLVGFRGEQEFGVHAGTAVATGHFQLVTGVIP